MVFYTLIIRGMDYRSRVLNSAFILNGCKKDQTWLATIFVNNIFAFMFQEKRFLLTFFEPDYISKMKWFVKIRKIDILICI